MASGPAGATNQKIAFDTDVLVWYFRGSGRARRFITEVGYPFRHLPSICLMELLQGCRNGEEVRQVRGFQAENFPVILHPDEEISRRAIGLLEQHAPSRGLRAADALIAATALEAGCSLATANVRHYRFITQLHLIPFRP